MNSLLAADPVTWFGAVPTAMGMVLAAIWGVMAFAGRRSRRGAWHFVGAVLFVLSCSLYLGVVGGDIGGRLGQWASRGVEGAFPAAGDILAVFLLGATIFSGLVATDWLFLSSFLQRWVAPQAEVDPSGVITVQPVGTSPPLTSNPDIMTRAAATATATETETQTEPSAGWTPRYVLPDPETLSDAPEKYAPGPVNESDSGEWEVRKLIDEALDRVDEGAPKQAVETEAAVSSNDTVSAIEGEALIESPVVEAEEEAVTYADDTNDWSRLRMAAMGVEPTSDVEASEELETSVAAEADEGSEDQGSEEEWEEGYEEDESESGEDDVEEGEYEEEEEGEYEEEEGEYEEEDEGEYEEEEGEEEEGEYEEEEEGEYEEEEGEEESEYEEEEEGEYEEEEGEDEEGEYEEEGDESGYEDESDESGYEDESVESDDVQEPTEDDSPAAAFEASPGMESETDVTSEDGETTESVDHEMTADESDLDLDGECGEESSEDNDEPGLQNDPFDEDEGWGSESSSEDSSERELESLGLDPEEFSVVAPQSDETEAESEGPPPINILFEEFGADVSESTEAQPAVDDEAEPSEMDWVARARAEALESAEAEPTDLANEATLLAALREMAELPKTGQGAEEKVSSDDADEGALPESAEIGSHEGTDAMAPADASVDADVEEPVSEMAPEHEHVEPPSEESVAEEAPVQETPTQETDEGFEDERAPEADGPIATPEGVDPEEMDLAVLAVTTAGTASIAVIRDELGVDTLAAAKWLSRLEEAGVIGMAQGTDRDVLLSWAEWQARREQA